MTQAVDLFSDFAINTAKAVEGTKVPYRGGVSFFIARASNRRYRDLAVAELKRLEPVLNSGSKEEQDEKGKELTVKLMAHTILVGWEGPLAFKGELLGEYTPEKAEQLLTGDHMEDLRKWIQGKADDQQLFKEVQEQADEKN